MAFRTQGKKDDMTIGLCEEPLPSGKNFCAPRALGQISVCTLWGPRLMHVGKV